MSEKKMQLAKVPGKLRNVWFPGKKGIQRNRNPTSESATEAKESSLVDPFLDVSITRGVSIGVWGCIIKVSLNHFPKMFNI